MPSRFEISSIAGVVIFTVLIVGTIIIIVALTKVNVQDQSWMIAGQFFAALVLAGSVAGLIVSAVGEAKLKQAGGAAASSVANWFNSPSNTTGGFPYSSP